MSAGYEIATYLVTGAGSQRKIAIGDRILKRKSDALLIILPDPINVKCLYSVTEIFQKFFEI